MVALDGRGGRVATRGLREVTDVSVLDLCGRMIQLGVEEVLYTDIERDGMLGGLDLDTLKDLADLEVSLIASGGVSSPQDVRSLLSLDLPRVTGVIVGKALYEKRVSLGELLELARGGA